METIIFKLEVLDHRAREKAGVITPTLSSPIPVLLTFDAAVEVNFAIRLMIQCFYNFSNIMVLGLWILYFNVVFSGFLNFIHGLP